MLYVPSAVEIPERCVHSVLQIRQFLTTELQSLRGDIQLSSSLRAMRAACRKFMDRVGSNDDVIRFGAHRGHWASWAFIGELGELRGVFGIHSAKFAAAHGLDVEDDLAVILPAESDDAD